MTEYAIVAPIGGASNHLRWLLLLDNKFASDKIIHDCMTIPENREISYNRMKGESWPGADVWPHDPLPENIEQEINHAYSRFLNIPYKLTASPPADMYSLIEQRVYPTDRTWHNWLLWEWCFRVRMNSYIKFSHAASDCSPTDRCIFLTITPDLAYKNYLKFNSNLNNTTVEHFKSQVEEGNNEIIAEAKKYPTMRLVLSGDRLFSSTLCKNFYRDVIDWFELEDNYAVAQHIHTLWYNLHKKAEQEFVNHITNFYKESL